MVIWPGRRVERNPLACRWQMQCCSTSLATFYAAAHTMTPQPMTPIPKNPSISPMVNPGTILCRIARSLPEQLQQRSKFATSVVTLPDLPIFSESSELSKAFSERIQCIDARGQLSAPCLLVEPSGQGFVERNMEVMVDMTTDKTSC